MSLQKILLVILAYSKNKIKDYEEIIYCIFFGFGNG
jgi:hypothetical protein